ncbi:thiol-disulfide oxidoreductase ResA [mine drainage metagenome]|uniref:Thiol-disulfide oxidoreductase ResA n=1 Tax=mine drainage metagenome TaxID=410659 RepID=A0A1J5SLK4_9ZZZZ
MKNRILFFISLFFSVALFAQNIKKPVAAPVKNISITLTPLKNCKVYLGSYYGKSRALVDSAWLNEKSTGAFKGNTKLDGGIYFVVSPQYTIQFELLIGNHQQFSITADTSQKDNAVIKGSADNDLFKEYSRVTMEKGKILTSLNQQFSAAKTKDDSAKFRNELIKANKDLQDYREEIIKKHPTSLLTTLLAAMKRPDVPAIPVVNGKPDSTYPYHFVKDHFWDDVAFNDDRLLRTPFFEPKLDDYLKYYVSPEPDSIIKEIKYILLSARTGKEMYPYLLTKFTNKYLNPEYMGQDKVFLYLFDNFYSKGDTNFLNAASRKMIFERAYSMMANQIGNPAPLLNLRDTTEKIISMYSIQSPMTLIVFWDPTCSHCKEELPRIDSIYRAKWKALGISVYAVNVAEKTMPELKKFVSEKHLSSDWSYVYEPKSERDAQQAAGLPNFRQLYDVSKTPTLYLLDEKKNIIAKQLSIEQFDDLIMAKLKKQKT